MGVRIIRSFDTYILRHTASGYSRTQHAELTTHECCMIPSLTSAILLFSPRLGSTVLHLHLYFYAHLHTTHINTPTHPHPTYNIYIAPILFKIIFVPIYPFIRSDLYNICVTCIPPLVLSTYPLMLYSLSSSLDALPAYRPRR